MDPNNFEEAMRIVFIEKVSQIAKAKGLKPEGGAAEIKLRNKSGDSRRTFRAICGETKAKKPQKVTFSDICTLANYLGIKPHRIVSDAEAYYESELRPFLSTPPHPQKKMRP